MKYVKICLFLCFFPLILSAQNDLKLWYDKPATKWIEALPIGNGFIGGMVFGGVKDEIIQLNEGSLWSGGPQQKNVNPEASKYLQPLREALKKKDFRTATDLSEKMQGYFTESFLPLGDLHIKQDFGWETTFDSYSRDLNLNEGIVTIKYLVDGVWYTREVFSSAPDSLMIIRISADKPGRLVLDLSLKSLLKNTITTIDNNQINMNGKAPARVDPSYYNKPGREPIIQDDITGCNGMRFQTVLKVLSDDGVVTANNESIHIKDATSVTLLLSAATSFNGFDKCPDGEGKDEKMISERYLKEGLKKRYDELKSRHIADFRQYFDRISFSLQGEHNPLNKKLPSDVRLKLYSYGNKDPELETLYFQYGRYLLISSSREGGTPANLQGIWNNEFRPPWSSNYTININTEMNYWLAEAANLSEMHQPLLAWIKDLSETGKITAKEYYNAKGWVAHHNSDIWALSNPVGNKGDGSPTWANWQMGGNWLCQHLWEHYNFTRDKEFLQNTAYPVMKEAALFCLDWLIEKDGYLITSPSTSPENVFVIDNKNYSVSEAATMDMAIIWDLFTNLIDASSELGIDKNFRKELIAKRAKLYPYHIGKQGQLLEWDKDYKELDIHHRHVSHLYGLYPGRQISPLSTPDLAEACAKSLEIRGDEGTGWSKAWKINLAARLLNGDHAYVLLRDILNYTERTIGGVTGGGTYPNFFDAHPPFQIDGNFGATSGMIEMLLQSHLEEIHLLPALPKAWPEGQIKGLKARGGFDVDIQWKNDKLEQAVVKSNSGNLCRLRTSVPVRIENTESEELRDGEYYINTFKTKVGTSYFIKAE